MEQGCGLIGQPVDTREHLLFIHGHLPGAGQELTGGSQRARREPVSQGKVTLEAAEGGRAVPRRQAGLAKQGLGTPGWESGSQWGLGSHQTGNCALLTSQSSGEFVRSTSSWVHLVARPWKSAFLTHGHRWPLFLLKLEKHNQLSR